MKKIYLLGFLLAGVLLGLTSCNDDHDELTDSTLTYYANLQMEGDEFMIVPIGSSFTDPGCKATLYDKNTGEILDVTDQIMIEGVDDVDPNTMGFYYITYSAVGGDGFLASVTRTVCVCDPSVTADMSGVYNTDMESSLYGANKTPFTLYAAAYGYTNQCTGITFTQIAPAFYEVNDLMGGWYDQIRGFHDMYFDDYGPIGMMTGFVSLDRDNNIQLISSYIDAWEEGLDYIKDGKFDPETGTISYSLSYSSSVTMDLVLHRVSE